MLYTIGRLVRVWGVAISAPQDGNTVLSIAARGKLGDLVRMLVAAGSNKKLFSKVRICQYTAIILLDVWKRLHFLISLMFSWMQ